MTIEAAWPWLAFAGLGMFHGLNPAMGWLFAVALGLHRQGRRTIQLALLPMAAGHAISIWVVAASVMVMGTLVNTAAIHLIAGSVLIVWAVYDWLYGHRHRVRVGMTAGVLGLALWLVSDGDCSRCRADAGAGPGTPVLKHADNWQRLTADFGSLPWPCTPLRCWR